MLKAVTWRRSNPVFASFYLQGLAFTLDNYSSLGPFVAAGSVLHQFLFRFSFAFLTFHVHGQFYLLLGIFVTSVMR